MKNSVKVAAGFTLIELLVVMAIIAILVTVSLASFVTSQMRGRDAARKNDLKQISSALELYYSDYGQYPNPLPDWGSEFSDSKGTVYFKVLPKDPAGGQNYFYRLVPGSANQKYQLFAHLENSQDINCLPDGTGTKNCTNPSLPAAAPAPTCGSGTCNFAITSPNTTPRE